MDRDGRGTGFVSGGFRNEPAGTRCLACGELVEPIGVIGDDDTWCPACGEPFEQRTPPRRRRTRKPVVRRPSRPPEPRLKAPLLGAIMVLTATFGGLVVLPGIGGFFGGMLLGGLVGGITLDSLWPALPAHRCRRCDEPLEFDSAECPVCNGATGGQSIRDYGVARS